ncbi:pimeloyl-ACP methyl ester carboxylesterase [Kitasatospora gansuensis]|uniref:Pimeloyl-ACP methyl ester carboxylesterase n=1 Tax=Kitasatospora gansuensis TaxID=258050 RepID=A0A7W7SDD8_9ACTN|nr:alpha/beta hydrolase [Kitasatospora gansuensis]MBB4948380.1 pimeloyl-ACP methyl ester carboxylesterase [Kitasatospora gansuensis]
MPTASLTVPGATLHYEVRGTGPVLLVSQSGEGDAERSTDLVAGLTDAYTVVTYDRRGLSRSRLDAPERGASLAEHAEDVHRLLAAVTDAPALMLGCSLGAAIGLHVAVRHPGQLRALIAHEPVTPRLLPAAEQAKHEGELTELQHYYEQHGLGPTLPEMARALGIDLKAATEDGLTPHPMDARRIANFDHFIRHDFSAIVHDTLDPDTLRTTPTRIIPAAGHTTPRNVFDRQCADALAELVDEPVREFPGGHNGNLSHPRAYAHRLRELLAELA